MKHRKPNRLPQYDYSRSGDYFVTTCVKDRKNVFGNINNGKIHLNEFGKIIEKQWVWLTERYNYIRLYEFVVMPNHFHDIIYIVDDTAVGGGRDHPLQRQQKIKPLPQLIGAIGAFKTTSSKLIHSAGLVNFRWQRSYYDHIIRNDISFRRISEYIVNNPLNWKEDKFFIA